MSETITFDDVAVAARAGCWRLEVEHSGPQVIWAAGQVLTSRVMELAGRVPFESEDVVGNGCRQYLSATLGDGTIVSCDFVGTNKPDAKPIVDIRLYSRPFTDGHGNSRRIQSIMCADNFSIGVDNVFKGGRKVQYFDDNPTGIPSWKDLDWSNLERICPITPEGTAGFLAMLSGELDKAPQRNFEAIAKKLGLTI